VYPLRRSASNGVRRAARIGLAVLVLLFVGHRYATYAEAEIVGYHTCVADPARFDGQRLVFPLWQVTSLAGDHYEISKVHAGVPIAGDPAGLEVGDYVSVAGRYRAEDGRVVETERHAHPWRVWKHVLGVLGTVLALAFLPLGFRVRDGELEERL
jgi:hypothetical protein